LLELLWMDMDCFGALWTCIFDMVLTAILLYEYGYVCYFPNI